MAGKGSRPRPIPNRKKYEAEFDRIFNTRPKKKETTNEKKTKK
jgi:hypothetical protein